MAREQCECGAGDVECSGPHRVALERFSYMRCRACGLEWTITEAVDDLADVVTSSEIIDVHALLESNQSLKELMGK